MAKLHLITYGCQMNEYDSERVAGLLKQERYELTDRPEEADLILLNTCSIREKAEDKVFSQLGVLRHQRLDEEGGPLGVEPGPEPVRPHLDGVAGHLAGAARIGGQHVPVGHEVEALELVLELDPVLERSQVVAEMELAGRSHPGQHAVPRSRHDGSSLPPDFRARSVSHTLAMRRKTYSA